MCSSSRYGSHVAAPHTVLAVMHATAACDHTGVVILGGRCISLDYGLFEMLSDLKDTFNKTCTLSTSYFRMRPAMMYGLKTAAMI